MVHGSEGIVAPSAEAAKANAATVNCIMYKFCFFWSGKLVKS